MIAFLDASALIYLLEGAEPFSSRVRDVLGALSHANSKLKTGISRLTWLECRVGPMKSGNVSLLKMYDDFFAKADLVWVELTPTVVELAASIRVNTGLKTPDCLQAASCLQLGPLHQFVTGDAAFQRVAQLNVQLLTG